MLISPSIASGDVLHIADEVEFADKYFDDIHIDIEDGIAVEGISFGMKVAKKVCAIAKKTKSIHLEVIEPLNYLEDLRQCNADIVFIQTDVLKDPVNTIQTFKKAGINTGIALGNRDIGKDYHQLYSMIDQVLISTAYHDDPKQIYQLSMQEYGLSLHKKYGYKIWLDGGINYDIYRKLPEDDIYAVVMGRAIYSDKKLALRQFKTELEKNI